MDRGLTSADPDDDEDVDVAGLVGTLIAGKYRVVRPIGSGSTGAVYVCQHVGLDKLVALKILHREMETNSNFVDQFKREARAASRLEHPNSVRVLDFGQESPEQGGALYIVMEYIEGRDLLQVLDEDGPFSAERAVNVMSQILDALAVAHNLGIVHRDLKPENILVRKIDADGDEKELVTVCDFGIALLSPTRLSGQANAELVNVSDDGMVVGTPAYMSPEQVRAEPQDSRSDIYSAGVVLFQLLTLQVPFSAETPLAVAVMHCSNLPPLPSEFGAVSPALEEICLKALNKAKEARYQSAREMRAALQRALQATPSPINRLPVNRLPGAMRWAAARAQPLTVPPPRGNTAPSSILPTELANTPGEGKGARMRLSLPLLGIGLVVIGTATVPILRSVGSSSVASPRRSAASAASRGVVEEHFVPPSAAVTVSRDNRAAANSGEAALLAGGKAAADRDAAVLASPGADVLARGEVASVTPAVAALPSRADPFVPEVASVAVAPVAVAPVADAVAAPDFARNAPTSPRFESASSPATSSARDKKPALAAARKPAASAQAHGAELSATPTIEDAASSMTPTATDRSQAQLSIVKLESWSGDTPASSPAVAVGTSTSQSTSLPRTTASVGSRKADEPRSSLTPDPEHASVTTGAIVARAAVSRASVRGALNMDAITECYREGLRAGAAPAQSITAEIEVSTGMNGAVAAADLRAPLLHETLRHCIEQVARRGRVREVDTGAAQATITLLFQPR